MPNGTVKGQVTIPQDIRRELGVVPISKVEFYYDRGKVFIKNIESPNLFERWVGVAKTNKTTNEFMKNLSEFKSEI